MSVLRPPLSFSPSARPSYLHADRRVARALAMQVALALAEEKQAALSSQVVALDQKGQHASAAASHSLPPVAASRAIFVPLDLCSCSSVVACARRVGALAREIKRDCDTSPRVDALVCNAGAFCATRETTEDGFERTLGANFLSHALLIDLLLPLLRGCSKGGAEKDAAHGGGDGGACGRVVSVSSSMHRVASVAELLADPMSSNGSYGVFASYAQSKLAQVVLSAELQRLEDERSAKLGGRGVAFVALHPGNVQTEVSRNLSSFWHHLYVLVNPLMRAAQPGLADAASTSVYAVAAPSSMAMGAASSAASRYHPLGGQYLEKSTAVPPNPDVSNCAAGRELHQLCTRLLSGHGYGEARERE